MRMFKRAVVLLGVLLFVSTQANATEDMVGKTLYTQVNIYSLKGKAVTWVNYHVDALIPVNTEVVVDRISGAGVTFTVKATGQRLRLKNKERHSGLDGKAWAAKHFASKKVDLSKFSKAEREAIDAAQVRVGMSKAAVLVAFGYPPAHKTPSLDSDYWLYWINRWNKVAVKFDGHGKVASVIN